MSGSILPYTAIVPTLYGHMLINRYDIDQSNALFKTGGAPEHGEILLLCRILDLLPDTGRKVFVDVGANTGTHTLGVAKHLGQNGTVHSFEPQRLMFQMICGSAALNSMTNIHCHNVAVGAEMGRIEVPQYDYFQPLNFGSIEFGREQKEPLHQQRGNDPDRTEHVPRITIDSFGFPALHLMKVDTEGMEFEVLAGAAETIARCAPVMFLEYLKVDAPALAHVLKDMGYALFDVRPNYLCIPERYAAVLNVNGLAKV